MDNNNFNKTGVVTKKAKAVYPSIRVNSQRLRKNKSQQKPHNPKRKRPIQGKPRLNKKGSNQQERMQDVQLERAIQQMNSFFLRRTENMEYRPAQHKLSLEIMAAIIKKQHYLCEAGVGIGKSYAYLIPAVINQSPTIIATSSIALQEQLENDAVFIYRYFKKHPSIIVIKGMSHYFCYQRYCKHIERKKDKPLEGTLLKINKMVPLNFENKAELCVFQERKNFPFTIEENIWQKICVDSVGNKCVECEHQSKCYYHQLREKAKDHMGITITNMNLLNADLRKRSQNQPSILCSDVKLLIIDEAHNLEEKVRDSFTSVLSYYHVCSLVDTIERHTEVISTADKELLKKTRFKIETFFSDIYNDIQTQQRENHKKKNFSEIYYVPQRLENLEFLYKSFDRLKAMAENRMLRCSDRLERKLKYVISELEETGEFFKNLYHANDNVFWAEFQSGSFRDVTVFRCPKDVKRLIYKWYFGNDRYRTICVSGTLTNQQSKQPQKCYEYFIQNTGFPVEQSSVGKPKMSPFLYDKNAMIYCPKNLPIPSVDRDAFNGAAFKELVRLINLTKGRAMILFTSKYDMEHVYDMLNDLNLPYRIYKQNSHSSQQEVFEQFKRDTHSILLGTGAFWEGIDAKGETLSSLIVFRLPFPVPEPIIDEKITGIKKSTSGKEYLKIVVPEMLIKLKQGIGRLLRSSTDTGIVAILDPRAYPGKRTYSDLIWGVLPIKNMTSKFSEIEEFWKKTCETR